MKEANNDIPQHWEWEYLSNVAKIVSGYAFKSSDFILTGIPVIKIANIGYSEFIWKEQQYLPKNFLKLNSDFIIKGGDLLIALTRPITNNTTKICRYPTNTEDGLLNQRVACIKECKVNEDFIFWYFQTNAFKEYIRSKFSETLQPNLSPKDLALSPIPLPPLPEQVAIVNKIEELFSELENGKQQLLTAQQQLKIYRQSLLKAAFEGRLTNEKVKDGELPEGWVTKKLNDIGSWKGGGTPSKANKVFWENGNILWVSPKDMKSRIIGDTIDKITAGAIENSSTRLIPQGSVLFVIRSGILRRTLPVALTITDVTVNQDLQAFTPNDAMPEYIYWYVLGKNDDIRKTCSKDGTTVESIESSLLRNYLIPICSLEEQQAIVEILESKLTVCDKLEETISESLRQTETLRQSILKKAFEGKLV